MTRVLVVGTTPPAGTNRGAALGRLVADHLAMGDRVEVWSPAPSSVAHVHDALTGLRLPLRLLAASRRFDEVVVRVEHGMPFAHGTGRIERAVQFILLGLALGRFGLVRIHLDSPIAIPGGVGGRPTRELWAHANVVVENDEDRDRMLAVPWLDADRIEVREPPEDPRPAPLPEWPKPDTAELRAAVMDVVRARASASRRLEEASEELSPDSDKKRTVKKDDAEKAARPSRDLTVAIETAGVPGRPGPVLVGRLVARRVVGRLRRVVGRLRRLWR